MQQQQHRKKNIRNIFLLTEAFDCATFVLFSRRSQEQRPACRLVFCLDPKALGEGKTVGRVQDPKGEESKLKVGEETATLTPHQVGGLCERSKL